MRVAAIVPVHGDARYLGETLDSLLGHDRAPDEVVVVDDASAVPIALSDGHAARCTLVRREHQGGPALARASGLERTGAELVALCDADDSWVEGKLAAQLAALDRRPEAAVCFGRALIVGADGEPTGARLAEPPAGPLPADSFGRMLFEDNPIPTSSAVVRRDALEAAGGFAGEGALPGDLDWDLWLRLVEHDALFVCEPDAVVRYRRHPGGVTADLAAIAEQRLAVQRAHAGLVDEATRTKAEADSLTLVARARVRERRYDEARRSLRLAGELRPPSARERALGALLRVPGLRAGLGRRSHYR